jgi:ketosteroid isomerase-like protein
MSQGNVEIVRRAFEALAREDWVALAEFISDDCEVHDFDTPDAAGNVYRGPHGFLDWLTEWDQAWERWLIRDLDLRPTGDDRVLALFRMRTQGRDSGIEMNREDAIAYTLHGGKISRIEYYNDQQQALEAVELSE